MADVIQSPLTSLSEDEKIFQKTVGDFAEEQIRPLAAQMDKQGSFAPGLTSKLFDLGMMGIEIPARFGGSEASFFMAILAVEQISRVDPSVGVCVDVQNTLVNNAILRWGTQEQKQRFLPQLAASTIGAYALSEAGSGSDAFALATRARRDGDHWALDGRKLWITNAAEAGLYIIMANADPAKGYRGITAFIVERQTPGFSLGKKEDKLGIRASSTCELILEECRVPAANVLGEVGRGYKVAIETLNEGRIGIGAQMIGLAHGALEQALAYAKERRQFGKLIGEFQAVQFQLAQMATEIEAARLLVYNAARLKDAGQPFLTEAAMAKYFSSRVAERAASQAVEIFGGYGFSKDFIVEKLYRDAKIGSIYEGTSNMQLQLIGRQILALH